MRSKLLERGLIIADLPGLIPDAFVWALSPRLTFILLGLSDVNKTRTRVTQRYIRQCSYVVLVAPIGRVITDNLVQKRLVEGFHTHGTRKMLVCTWIDVSVTLS